MPKLIKPITIEDPHFLINVLRHCLEELGELKILDQELGKSGRGMIDLLGVDQKKRANLLTICQEKIEDGLLRALKGYYWFKENQSLIRRIFSSQDISFDLPAQVCLMIGESLVDTAKIACEFCKIPIGLYRYTCFAPKDDPLIYIEPLEEGKKQEIPFPTAPEKPLFEKIQTIDQTVTAEEVDINEIKKRLKIEQSDLNEKEVKDILKL